MCGWVGRGAGAGVREREGGGGEGGSNKNKTANGTLLPHTYALFNSRILHFEGDRSRVKDKLFSTPNRKFVHVYQSRLCHLAPPAAQSVCVQVLRRSREPGTITFHT